jgi:prephenate dehydrogenase
MQSEKISIIGAGLLGGSLGLAIRQRNVAASVHAYVRRAESVAEVLEAGAATSATLDLAEAVRDANLVIICTPLGQMRELAEKMRAHVKPGTIVTDVGSTKESVVRELEPIFASAKCHFVGSHPMAGSEKTGVKAARGNLFNNAVCVVTPTQRSDADAVCAVLNFWKLLGAQTIKMSPELHDDLVSRSSHLPHVIAAELANYVLSPVHPKEQSLVCATGFRDTTRIAASSPEMWRDISLTNRKNLIRVLGVFIEDLQEFQHALERQDKKAIEEFFANAKQRREQWNNRAAGASPE